MLKKLELAQPTSCLNKAAADEPVFVLRAKDPHAPQTLRHWATMSEGTHEPDKLAEARQCADEMERWRAQRFDAEGSPHPQAAPPHTLTPAVAPWHARAASAGTLCRQPGCEVIVPEGYSYCHRHALIP